MQSKFKVLLIEHETYRHDYKNTIENVGGQVDLIESANLDKIKNCVDRGYYDIVITDAFFLEKDKDHLENEDAEENYKLPEIIRAIRSKDQRVKIVVYTSYNSRISSSDLDKADYIFDKRYIMSDLFGWQINKICTSEISDDFRELRIVTELLNLCKQNKELPWADNIIKMLKGYRNGNNEQAQVANIKSSFELIFQEFQFVGDLTIFFEKIIKNEPLQIVSSPGKWGHLRHVINVYWLGYYIINSDVIDRKLYCDTLFGKDGEDSEKIIMLNKAWLIAALFHDIGHFGEKLNDLIKQINQGLELYTGNNKLNENQFHYTNNEYESLIGKLTKDDQKLINLINENHNDKKIDHGFLSCLTLHERIGKFSDNKDYEYLMPALKAITFHNLFEKNFELLKKYNFSNYPFENLLILCDHLETWDRDTGFENMYDEIPLEKIELYELKKMNDALDITINYVMFRSSLPGEIENRTHDKLVNLINKYVLPLLRELNGSHMPRIRVKFLLNNKDIMLEEFIPSQKK